MIKIDVHADDYGLTMNTSKDIICGINASKLNSISVMPNTTCFEEAKEYFFANVDKDRIPPVSVHLNFMEGYCVADKKQLDYLVDQEGLFNISWGSLIKYNYNFIHRDKVKEQLKYEIRAQIDKVINAYQLLAQGKKLRVDSHQHTHMIPLVMEALVEVLKEENIPTEYIRMSKEPWIVYLKKMCLLPTYRIINIVKVIVLNWYSIRNSRLFEKIEVPDMYLSGVFLSGKMDSERVKTLLPELKKYSENKGRHLEVLFHPGHALDTEIGEEFNHPEANKFYLSINRKVEYEAVMKLDF